MITIIAAIDKKNALGNKNQLLFYLPADLKHFKALTTGHTVVMGRKTFESLPKGALPNRRNIVLTKHGRAEDFPGAEVFGSINEALASCQQEEEIFILGGASVYQQALPLAQRLCLTEIDATAEEADTHFPTIDKNIWKEYTREEHAADDRNEQAFAFVNYLRQQQEQ